MGCLVPPLTPAGKNIIELRGLLLSLRDLVDPGTVCRLYGVTLEDLKLLAAAEQIINEINPPPQGAAKRGARWLETSNS